MNEQETYTHLVDRGMCPHFYNLTIDAGVVSFPLYQFNGRQVGYQNYRPFAERNHKNAKEARYFTYLPKGTDGYFGLESLTFPGKVYLVEGVFKAANLHRLGHPSVALMGSEVARHREQLFLFRRDYVGIGDNDGAGHKFAKQLNGFTSPRDLDEMEDDEIRELLWAKMV